jgi:hypothetical protein
MRVKNQTGHRDRLSKDPSFNKLLMSCRGHEKKLLYAWVRSDGKLLCDPSDNLEKITSMRERMQKECDEEGYNVLLDTYFYDGTEQVLYPPPDPEDEKMCRGGHAVGGPADLDTPEEVLSILKRTAEQQYTGAKDCKFYVEGNSAFIEHKNVRAWVTRSDELGMDKPLNLPFQWSAHVTMIKNWNDDYHDVHLGSFRWEYDAIEEAMTAFIRYQIIEERMDHY